ncbi:MAG: hypothetical protein AB7U76_24070 [Pirellulales bacterium]
MPVDKQPGMPVFAATFNPQGALEIEGPPRSRTTC